MRAARLLQILLILQNRGRQSARSLAEELEVSQRTILRDLDAMTEAGLPVVAIAGRGGGIELGFNYRLRLTGLALDEAGALGILLAAPNPLIDAIGLAEAAGRARAKLIEFLPDRPRMAARAAATRFVRVETAPVTDHRIAPVARAVSDGRIIRLQARSQSPRVVWPVRLSLGPDGWVLTDVRTGDDIGLAAWGDVNITNRPIPQPVDP
jgi:predicted DNA-binding transcriptional regulator YafY